MKRIDYFRVRIDLWHTDEEFRADLMDFAREHNLRLAVINVPLYQPKEERKRHCYIFVEREPGEAFFPGEEEHLVSNREGHA